MLKDLKYDAYEEVFRSCNAIIDSITEAKSKEEVMEALLTSCLHTTPDFHTKWGDFLEEGGVNVK